MPEFSVALVVLYLFLSFIAAIDCEHEARFYMIMVSVELLLVVIVDQFII